MKRWPLFLMIACLGAADSASAAPLPPHAELLRLLPDTVNVVLTADVQSIYKSKLAQRAAWETTTPLPTLPPQLSEVVLGARFDPANPSANAIRVGLGRLRKVVTMDELAQREQGAVETIAQRQAVLSARNAYFVRLDNFGTIGVQAPANRQELARWVTFTLNNPKIILPSFLQESAAATDKETQILLAVDLTDAFSPQAIRARLADSKIAKENAGGLDSLAKVLASLRGIRLAIRIDDKINGEFTVEFGENAAPLSSLALPLLLEVLERRGMQFDDLENWQVDVRENRVVFRGQLSETGLREALSLVQLPEPASAESGKVAREVQVAATQGYLQAVNTSMKDLKKINSKQRSYKSIVVWYEKNAEKIDQLSTAQVDEDVVKYGLDMASKLRAIAASLHGEIVSVVNLQGSKNIVVAMQPTAGWLRRPYNNDGGSMQMATNVPEQSSKQGDALTKGVETRNTIWRYIDDQTAAIRYAMRSKYKTEF